MGQNNKKGNDVMYKCRLYKVLTEILLEKVIRVVCFVIDFGGFEAASSDA